MPGKVSDVMLVCKKCEVKKITVLSRLGTRGEPPANVRATVTSMSCPYEFHGNVSGTSLLIPEVSGIVKAKIAVFCFLFQKKTKNAVR